MNPWGLAFAALFAYGFLRYGVAGLVALAAVLVVVCLVGVPLVKAVERR